MCSRNLVSRVVWKLTKRPDAQIAQKQEWIFPRTAHSIAIVKVELEMRSFSFDKSNAH